MAIAETDQRARQDIPIAETWDLTNVFETEAAFAEGLAAVDSLVTAGISFQGRLGESAQTLADAFTSAIDLQHLVQRLIVYSRLSFDVDTTDPESQSRLDAATGVAIRANQALAWFDPELLEIPEATLDAYLSDPVLKPWFHQIDDIVRNRPYTRSSEVEALLASVSDIGRTARDAFGALDNADLTYGTVRDEDGNEIELTKGRFQVLEESKDRSVRQQAFETFMTAYQQHKHVLAALHAGNVRNGVFYARARNYPSARFGALNANYIDEQVYDTLIDVTRSRIDVVGRYYELRRQILGIEQLELWDSWVPLSQLPTVHYTWNEAIDLVCEGLGTLGPDYVSIMRDGLTTGRWVDVHESKGKRSGAYSWSAYGSPPKILMNWNGTLSDVFTLAHEAGHAMHSYFANQAQPFQDAGYPIFLAEIASTLNEVLLTWHLLGKLGPEQKMERFAILNRFADQILGTHVRQTMFAEFERETHRITEATQPLVLQTMTEL
ncbi:MAG TPA: M3 family oligoendopeptidase, partial [Thermomicrobiales bacterium]|nr:M3 family oligoendopeptidase [Thermomicrobiales bacterium]